MQSSVSVSASGPAMALLLYENTKISGNQMGFLLGAVVNRVTDTISDSQISDEKIETIINISSILPIPSSCRVMNGAGRIDREKLNAIVKAEKNQQLKNQSQTHDIVGWYSFKRNEVYQMSIRERVVHLQLTEMAKDFCQTSTPELFVLCLLSSNLMSKATHVFKHSFMCYLSEKNTFDLIPLQIQNLGMPQSTQYQNTACVSSREALLTEIFDRIGPQMQDRDHTMLQVQAELQIMLNQRVQQLSTSEDTRMQLENEVDSLKKQIEDMERNLQLKQNQQGQNNGSDERHERQSNHERSRNRNSVGDVSFYRSSPQINKKMENQYESDRTSPILGATRRPGPNHSQTPDLMKRTLPS